jgi:anthranilate phosphoribosyltransferase
VLSGEQQGAARDALLLGTALALEVTGTEAAPRLAIARAAQAIDSGAAAALLSRLAEASSGVASTEVSHG